MDRESWRAAVHGVAKNQTRLRNFTFRRSDPTAETHGPQTSSSWGLFDQHPAPSSRCPVLGALLLGPAQLGHGSRQLTAKEIQTIVKEGRKLKT